ncbi:MAG: hypothetical protein ACRD1W_09630 [Vicinamibacterales bacterium]
MKRLLRAWLARIAGFLRPGSGEREFADELQSHVDLVAAAVPARRVLRADPVTTLRCD